MLKLTWCWNHSLIFILMHFPPIIYNVGYALYIYSKSISKIVKIKFYWRMSPLRQQYENVGKLLFYTFAASLAFVTFRFILMAGFCALSMGCMSTFVLCVATPLLMASWGALLSTFLFAFFWTVFVVVWVRFYNREYSTV